MTSTEVPLVARRARGGKRANKFYSKLSEEEKKVSKLCKQVRAISKADPSKAGPKSMLVQAMMNVAKAKKDWTYKGGKQLIFSHRKFN